MIAFYIPPKEPENPTKARLRELYNTDLLPIPYKMYMDSLNINPSVIYDIGACVLHWTLPAKKKWPTAKYFAFEAMECCDFLYQENNIPYHVGVLSNIDYSPVKFYENKYHPGGNSYYKENVDINPVADQYFNETHAIVKTARTLDSVVSERKFLLPDLVKIDVQGAELDVLKGGVETLKHAKDILIEIAHVEYNKGAPHHDEVVNFLNELGFQMVANFTRYDYDGDYHFTKV